MFHRGSESISFSDVHGPFLDLLPPHPGRALDVGAGTGRDAAALAEAGWAVDAVEPVADFRSLGQIAHPSERIHWLDDVLPHLTTLQKRSGEYELVIVSAVWMHLSLHERMQAMPVLSRLSKASGLILLTLRHGPVPTGRWMDDVSGDETVRLAIAAGLTLIRRLDDQSSAMANKRDVTWTRLAFSKC